MTRNPLLTVLSIAGLLFGLWLTSLMYGLYGIGETSIAFMVPGLLISLACFKYLLLGRVR